MSNNTINSTTQEYLDVYDITNDMVILKDGVVSIIMQIGTMNFSLLAEQEQDAIMYTYGALLNSLNFSIQINIQSNVKDATRYLRLLDSQMKQAKSREKAQLITEYREFVANLIRERNVLEKKFFVVIPTNAGEMGLYTAENILPGKSKFDINSYEKTVLIEKAATVLEPRRDHLIAQFNRIGLFARQLDTQEIIKNFYINYNPESMEGQEITNSESYTTPIVRASLAGEQNPDQVTQNFRQTLTSSLGQRTDQEQPSTTKQSGNAQTTIDQSKEQEFLDQTVERQSLDQSGEEQTSPVVQEKNTSINKPEDTSSGTAQTLNFSEEITSLQPVGNIKPEISQTPSQSLPQQFSPTSKREEELSKLKLEVPPVPTIGQTSKTTTNKPPIAEL